MPKDEPITEELEPIVSEPVVPVPGPKRPPGVKEIIPMAWKLVGISDGLPVTLLKCIDRTEAEAQLVRLQGERYYQNLGIFAINEEAPLSASQLKSRKKLIEEASSRPTSGSSAARKDRPAVDRSKPAAKSPAGKEGERRPETGEAPRPAAKAPPAPKKKSEAKPEPGKSASRPAAKTEAKKATPPVEPRRATAKKTTRHKK